MQDNISQVDIREILSLRVLIECSSKDINLLLANLEGRLQSVVEHNSQQVTQDSIENGVKMQKTTNIKFETDHEMFPGIGFKMKWSDKTIDLEKEQEQAPNVNPPNATAFV
jgi:hypothetical protein